MPAEPRLANPQPAQRAPSEAARMVRMAQNCLRASGYRALAKISCEYHEGVLILRGNVPTFYMKQVAQTQVKEMAGVQQVDNRLSVVQEP